MVDTTNTMRKTKIACTISPKTESYEMLKTIALMGMNIARLNMSHGGHGWHGQVIHHLKRLNRNEKRAVAILLDTKGPETRTGDVNTYIPLKNGYSLTFTIRREAILEPNCVEVSYKVLLMMFWLEILFL